MSFATQQMKGQIMIKDKILADLQAVGRRVAIDEWIDYEGHGPAEGAAGKTVSTPPHDVLTYAQNYDDAYYGSLEQSLGADLTPDHVADMADAVWRIR
jgi:hypothetical protein